MIRTHEAKWAFRVRNEEVPYRVWESSPTNEIFLVFSFFYPQREREREREWVFVFVFDFDIYGRNGTGGYGVWERSVWPIGPARTQEKQTEREGPKFEEIIFYSCIDVRKEMGSSLIYIYIYIYTLRLI